MEMAMSKHGNEKDCTSAKINSSFEPDVIYIEESKEDEVNEAKESEDAKQEKQVEEVLDVAFSNNNARQNALHTSNTAPSDIFVVQKKKKFTLSYDVFVWLVFGLLTLFCVIDRFVMSGDCVLQRKGKKVSKLYGENVGETIANIVWGVTARIIIVSQNMMFYTTLWCIPNFIYENAPNFIKIYGIRDSHIRMHRIIGIFLIGIPSLAHVLVCFIPPLIDKTSITYHPPSEFNYSTQFAHLNWSKFYDPAAVQGWVFNDEYGVHLTSDELYRFIMVIALFCLLFPLSRSSFLSNRSYSLGIAIHVFSGIWYSVDNIRKITHGLAHAFNLPFMLFWCLDRLYSILFYRKHTARLVKEEIIGNYNYVKLYVKFDDIINIEPGVGDIYYLKEQRKGVLSHFERSHPFTSFSNHECSQTMGDNGTRSWDIGFVITVMDDRKQWYPACTRSIAENSEEKITVWGPYRSSTWQLHNALDKRKHSQYVLLCSGSGFGYLLDTLGMLAYDKNITSYQTKIDIYYTVRYNAFRKSFLKEIEDLLAIIKERKMADVKFRWYITDTNCIKDGETDNENLLSEKINGRIDFESIISKIEPQTPVFFVGRPFLADKISEICSKYNVSLVKDHTNTERGVSDKTLMVKYLKYTAYVLLVTIATSLALSVYLKR